MSQLSRMVAVCPPEGMPIAGIMDWTAELEATHGSGLLMRNVMGGRLAVFTPGFDCYCLTCEALHLEDQRRLIPDSFPSSRFVVCSECGNKRCPKATFHENECTESNEPDQKGSVYAGTP